MGLIDRSEVCALSKKSFNEIDRSLEYVVLFPSRLSWISSYLSCPVAARSTHEEIFWIQYAFPSISFEGAKSIINRSWICLWYWNFWKHWLNPSTFISVFSKKWMFSSGLWSPVFPSVHGNLIVNPAFALLLAILRSTQERVSEAMFSNPKGHFHGLNGSFGPFKRIVFWAWFWSVVFHSILYYIYNKEWSWNKNLG